MDQRIQTAFAHVLQNRYSLKFHKFRRRTPALESLLNKVADSNAGIFEICEIFKNTFFYRTSPVTASKAKEPGMVWNPG